MSVNGLTWCVCVLAVFHLRPVSSTPVMDSVQVQVQLHEHKIAQQNNTAYVQRVMRLAKAAEMRNYMRPEVDACDNFYEYSCGNWPKINPAEDQNPRETNFFKMLTNSYNQKQLKVLREGKQPNETATDAKVKQFFNACDRMARMAAAKYKQKLRDIIEEYGYMPAVVWPGSWDGEKFDWLDTIGNIQHKYSVDILIQIAIRQDFDNKTVNKVFIGQPAFKLPTKSMYTEETSKWHREMYKQKIAENLQRYLGIKAQRAEETAEQILALEMRLAQGMISERSGATLRSESKLRTMKELHEEYGNVIDFERYINTALGLELNDTVYEFIPSYLTNLVEVVNSTSKEQLANYIMYQLVQVFFVNTEEKAALREQKCLEKTKHYFAKVLDNMIYRKYHNRNTQRDINLIWQKLRQTFRAELESDKLNWMSLMTRKLAIEKLESMRLEVSSYENTNFSAEFAGLHLSGEDYVQHLQHVHTFNAQRSIKELSEAPKPVDEGVTFSFTPAYVGLENLIRMPVSLLQPYYLWSDYYPNALKFGTLGFLVAHELIHGFDDMGRNFDAQGNERNWWDGTTTDAFNTRKQCFKEQYARYRYGGRYLAESELQAENIADNGGVQLAYTAYLSWLEDSASNETEAVSRLELETLPGLNYTSKQLFFLSFAQFWCNDVTPQFKDLVSLVDVHAPAMFRVIGTLANFGQFSEQFQCAPGSTMNRDNKCEIY